MRARKRPVFFGPESQLCMQFGFTQSSETECNGAIVQVTRGGGEKYAESCAQAYHVANAARLAAAASLQHGCRARRARRAVRPRPR